MDLTIAIDICLTLVGHDICYLQSSKHGLWCQNSQFFEIRLVQAECKYSNSVILDVLRIFILICLETRYLQIYLLKGGNSTQNNANFVIFYHNNNLITDLEPALKTDSLETVRSIVA